MIQKTPQGLAFNGEKNSLIFCQEVIGRCENKYKTNYT